MRTNPFTEEDPEQREAIGSAYHTIWLPFKANGAVITGYRMMYSRKPLTWKQIDQLEGSPVELAKRTTEVDGMSVYEGSKNFDLNTGPIGPVAPALLDQNEELVPPPKNPRKTHSGYLDEHREHKFAMVYLDAVPRVLTVKFEYGIGKDKLKDLSLTLQSHDGWAETLYLKDLEDIEPGWLQADFNDYPEGAIFDLIKDPGQPGMPPEYLFYNQTIGQLQRVDEITNKAAAAAEEQSSS